MINDDEGGELISDDLRKSKEDRRKEKRIELIKLAENSPFIGFPLSEKVWTVNKSDLIAKYLYGFLSVTRNGIFIDAFSGPQNESSDSDSWTAKKVLNMDSVFLKKAYLFDLSDKQIEKLNQMVSEFKSKDLKYAPKIFIFQGDSNSNIPQILSQNEHEITERKAVLALLDQRLSLIHI